MFLMPCLIFPTHEPSVDSRGDSGFSSIKTGSSVTPDPIKLLAAVHDHDMNNNATKDDWKARQKHDTLQTDASRDGNFTALK